MRYLFFLPLTICLFCSVVGVSQTNISGIVNSYAAVSSLDTCLGALTAEGDLSGFVTGQKLLIIQMKGASISTTNNSSFGTITDMAGAGLYEIATILYISGQQICLEKRLLNTYDFTQKVQAVSVAAYENAWVTDTVFAKAWDGTTGGIVAIDVSGTLTLQYPISATAKGFSGGVSEVLSSNCTSLTNANNFSYGTSDWHGAAKGEGVAVWLSGMESGRGAQSNAGGGGNDHNSGGGGGGGTAVGGDGGQNDEPYFLNCSGEFPGKGSKPLPILTNRGYFGGGGGSGHRNNNNNCDGGAGGGLVFVWANTIAGNGQDIQANGGNAASVKQDGGGGGGGGGMVFVETNLISGSLTLRARGGNGGSVNNQNNDRCFGPGGGGGGGQVRSNSLGNVITDLLGGVAGSTFNSINACNGTTVGAQMGENGSSGAMPSISEGTLSWQQPLQVVQQPTNINTLCDDEQATLSVVATGVLAYQWQMDIGLGFQPINDNIIFSGTTTPNLNILGGLSSLNNAAFQCVIAGGNCFTPSTIVSQTAILQVLPTPNAAFSYTSNGTIGTLTATDPTMDTYTWTLQDGTILVGPEVNFDFLTTGDFQVTLTTTNSCGTVTNTQTITISTIPEAQFTSIISGNCSPVNVSFVNQSSTGTYTWAFEGGTPNASNAQNPTVNYLNSGVFSVRLIVVNQYGSDTLYLPDYITVIAPPTASFVQNTNVFNVQFANNSQGATDYLWGFGDNTNSTLATPNHTYPSTPNTYTVTLTASNECGSSSTTQTVTVGQQATATVNATFNGGCAPLTTTLFGIGQFVDTWSWDTPGATTTGATTPQVTLVYDQPGIYDVHVTVANAGGSNTISFLSFIEVVAFPEAEFSFEKIGTSVQFSNLSSNAEGYEWDFGDNSLPEQSFEANHIYGLGSFVATLTAFNDYCADSYSLVINTTDTQQPNPNPLQITPQPADSWVEITWPNTLLLHSGSIQLFSASGALVGQQNIYGNSTKIPTAQLPSGIYPFRLITETGTTTVGKIVVMH